MNLADDNREVTDPDPSPHSQKQPLHSHVSEGSSDSSQSEGMPVFHKGGVQASTINSQRPVFSLALNKLQPAGAEGTPLESPSAPQSTRRQLSSKLRKFVNFFERAAFTRAQSIDEVDLLAGGGKEATVTTVQTARAALGGSYSSLPPSTLGSSTAVVPQSSRAISPTAADTPRSLIKLPPQRMGSVRDIIKRFDPEAGDLSARSLRRESSVTSEMGSIVTTPLKRAATLQPSIGSGQSPTIKWQQVEKRVEGKVVGKVWRKFEVASDAAPLPLSSTLPSEAEAEGSTVNVPSRTSLGGSILPKDRSPTVPSPKENVEPSTPTGNAWSPIPTQPEALLMFDPIGEGDEENISEGSSSYSSDEDEDDADDPAHGGKLGRHGDSPILGHAGGRGASESGVRDLGSSTNERRKKRRAGTTESGGTPQEDANKTKRASHFVAIRIDDPDVVDAVSRFQGELLHSAPFLDHCKSNVNKLHLTLLVLSLTPADIPRAKQAMQLGVQRFMKAKAGILEAHRAAGLRDELQGFESSSGRSYAMQAPRSPASHQENFSEGKTKEDSDVAFKLDFRTIGAFGTRVLFLSPPLRQRLLLQQFHVELARAFGEHGISIVGAGSGWNSAMEIQKQVRARSDEKSQTDAATHRKSVDSTTASSVSNAANKLLAAAVAAGTDVKTPSPEHLPPNTAILPAQPLQHCTKPTSSSQTPSQQRVYPESATPLDKMLLRQYDLSSARTALYIPQITLFKISKAAKRNKSKTPATTNMPKLKLFPRLYHNLVQRVLQSGLPAPRVSQQPSAHREQVLMTIPRSYEVYEALDNNAVHLNKLATLSAQMAPTHWSLISTSPHLEGSKGLPIISSGTTSEEIRSTSGPRKRPVTTTSLYTPAQYMTFSPGSFTPLMQRTPQHSAQSPVASSHYVATAQVGSCNPSPSTIVTSSSPQTRQYHFFPTQAQTQFAYAQYFAATSPSHSQEAIIYAAQQAALQQQEVIRRFQQQESANGRGLYWPHPMCMPPAAPSQAPSHISDSYHQPQSGYKTCSHPALQSPRRRSTSNERRSPSLNGNTRQRLKLDKVITTSWAPIPPFGCQPCAFVELLEMSQMDPDGYYKRICRTMLTPNAEVIDNLIFQPSQDDPPEETSLPTIRHPSSSDERSTKQAAVIMLEGQAVLSS